MKVVEKNVDALGGKIKALRADGTVIAWGYNDYGRTEVPVGLSNVVTIAAGWRHSLGLLWNPNKNRMSCNSHSLLKQ